MALSCKRLLMGWEKQPLSARHEGQWRHRLCPSLENISKPLSEIQGSNNSMDWTCVGGRRLPPAFTWLPSLMTEHGTCELTSGRVQSDTGQAGYRNSQALSCSLPLTKTRGTLCTRLQALLFTALETQEMSCTHLNIYHLLLK